MLYAFFVVMAAWHLTLLVQGHLLGLLVVLDVVGTLCYARIGVRQ